MTANIIGVVPEYEWRISTPNQLTRRIQKVNNLSLNMWGVEENKVCEALDVTARRLDPLNPPILSHIFERVWFFRAPSEFGRCMGPCHPKNLILDPIADARRFCWLIVSLHLQMMFLTKWPHIAGIQTSFKIDDGPNDAEITH